MTMMVLLWCYDNDCGVAVVGWCPQLSDGEWNDASAGGALPDGAACERGEAVDGEPGQLRNGAGGVQQH